MDVPNAAIFFLMIHQPQANWPSLTFQTFIYLSESDLALPFSPIPPHLRCSLSHLSGLHGAELEAGTSWIV